MTAYLTEFDPTTRQPLSASQALPCGRLDEAATFMGEPSSRYAAMLIYYGSPAYCVTRFPLCIDAPGSSGQNSNVINSNGSN